MSDLPETTSNQGQNVDEREEKQVCDFKGQ